MVVDKNFKDFTSLLTTSDGVRSSKKPQHVQLRLQHVNVCL
jgi:hypothetical protein